jgi:tetratricopeptide (TPR) repeat protein
MYFIRLMRLFFLIAACVGCTVQAATVEEARAALLAGQYGKAAQLFAPLVYSDPQDSMLRLSYGLALEQSAQYAAAERELSRVVKELPKNANAWLLLGLSFQKREMPEQAIQPLEHAVLLAPGQSFAKVELADAYLTTGRVAEARDLFQALTEEDPSIAKAWQGLGLAHLSIARREPVKAAEEEAASHKAFDHLAHMPESPELHELLADAHQQQGRRQEAVEEWKKAVRLEPSTWHRGRYAEALWANRSYEEAEPVLRQITTADPNNAQWQYLLGDVLFRQRRSEEALPHLLAAVRLKPALLPAHAVLGRVYMQLEKPALAIPHLEKGQSTDSDAIAFQLSRARRQLVQRAPK